MRRKAILLLSVMVAALVVASGVALAATTQTFTNPAPITIPNPTLQVGPAVPYPSPITSPESPDMSATLM
jgi:hypothetical protein